MKTIIFSATNDRGEPLIDIAGKQGEIWTARRNTKLKEGDTVRLIRKYRGKHEYEGVVEAICVETGKKNIQTGFYMLGDTSGFTSWDDWYKAYQRINDITFPRKVYFIHITNIRKLP